MYNPEENKWKTYRKTAYKKMKTKYLRIETPLNEKLEEYAQDTWLSHSYILAEALLNYLTTNSLWKK